MVSDDRGQVTATECQLLSAGPESSVQCHYLLSIVSCGLPRREHRELATATDQHQLSLLSLS